jgi:hypothetical protein
VSAKRVAAPTALGIALVLVPALRIGLVIRIGADGAGDGGVARTRPANAGSAVSDLQRIDRIALGQLRLASRQLDQCVGAADVRASPAGLTAYRGCARWPLAHIAVDGKVNGTILYAIGQQMRDIACRALVVGRANNMKLLSADATALVHGLWDASRSGRQATGGGAGAMTALLRSLGREIRHAGVGACGREVLAASA